MLKRTIAPLVLLCALAVLQTGCSDEPVPTNGPVPIDVPDRPIRKIPDTKVVSKAVQSLQSEHTGTFASTLYIAGNETSYAKARGAFDLTSSESRLRLTSISREGKRTVYEYRLFEDGFAVRTIKRHEVGCWSSVVTVKRVLPSQVQALLSAEGSEKPSRVGGARGTVPLGEAVGVLGPSWTALVRVHGAPAMQTRLPVRFEIEKGRFIGWTLDGRPLLKSFKALGIKVVKEMRSQVANYVVEVKLDQPGPKVDVSRPHETC